MLSVAKGTLTQRIAERNRPDIQAFLGELLLFQRNNMLVDNGSASGNCLRYPPRVVKSDTDSRGIAGEGCTAQVPWMNVRSNHENRDQCPDGTADLALCKACPYR